jgi:GTP-binding protein
LPRLVLDYAGSAETPDEFPRWALAEIALVGRSNSGKSSLLNCLAGRRELARVSKTPGRTRRLHFFADARAGLALVDLPGYGFARAGKGERDRFAAAVDRYLRERQALRAVVLLLDVRRAPERDERLIVDFAGSRRLAVVRVATKVDKLGRAERMRCLGRLDAAGLGQWLPFSSTTREGREAVIEAVMSVARKTPA